MPGQAAACLHAAAAEARLQPLPHSGPRRRPRTCDVDQKRSPAMRMKRLLKRPLHRHPMTTAMPANTMASYPVGAQG